MKSISDAPIRAELRLNMDAVLIMSLDDWKAHSQRLSAGDMQRFRRDFPELARGRDDAAQQIAKWLHIMRPVDVVQAFKRYRAEVTAEHKTRTKSIKAWDRFVAVLEDDLQVELQEHIETIHNRLHDIDRPSPGRPPEPHLLLAVTAAELWRLPAKQIIEAMQPIDERQAASIRAKLANMTKQNDIADAMNNW